MLGAVALVAVWEEQGQPRGLAPLRESGDDELVDRHLRAVDEVAELRLPADEGLGRGHRVAVLEREAGRLGERRVVDLERRGRLAEVLDRREELSVLRVVQNEVAVRERAARRVLAGQPYRNPLDEQAREGELLPLAPVDSALVESQ